MTENSEFLSRIRDLAEPVARREGCEIYDIEWVSGHHGKGRTLRVYIEKEGGVGIDDCSNVSRGLNLILDVDDVIPGSGYNLEVSSPGLERTLREFRHFSKAVGSVIQVKLRETKENLKSFKGRLTAVEEASDPDSSIITVDLGNAKLVQVSLNEILKARVVFVETKQAPKGGTRGEGRKKNRN